MDYIAAILPSIGIGAVFFFTIRAIFNADRSERQAQAQSEEEVKSRNAKSE